MARRAYHEERAGLVPNVARLNRKFLSRGEDDDAKSPIRRSANDAAPQTIEVMPRAQLRNNSKLLDASAWRHAVAEYVRE